jgi:rod shape-determining protein MreC
MRRLTRRQRIATIVLTVVALCFLTLDLGGSGLRTAHSGVRGSLGALYRGTDAVLGPVREFVRGLPAAGSNQAKVTDLEHDIAVLRGELANRQADATTALQLHRLQLAADSGRFTVLPARVVALGAADGFDWTVTVDAGSASGVRVGQTVTDGYGLVGRVLHADPSTSIVLLAADPGSGVGARDERDGQVGVCTGLGAEGFAFVPLDPHASVRTGDHLVTGPVGSTSYQPGLSVGVVTAVRSSADGTVRAIVVPTAPATALDLVGVIVAAGQASAARPGLQPSSGPR